MSKKWAKYYLLLGTVIIAAISLIGSMAFVRTNINQAQDKYEFESIYIRAPLKIPPVLAIFHKIWYNRENQERVAET